MNTKVLFAATLLAVFFTMGTMQISAVAFAQYMGNVGGSGSGETGQYTLEEALELQRRRIESAEANPAAGSGTPYLSADGVCWCSNYCRCSLWWYCRSFLP